MKIDSDSAGLLARLQSKPKDPARFSHLNDAQLPDRLTPVPVLTSSDDEQEPVRRKRKRKVSLSTVAKQARAAGIEAAKFEVHPDGKIVIIPGKSDVITNNEPTSNEWDTIQ